MGDPNFVDAIDLMETRRICFAFQSRGVGGTEVSMLRLLRNAPVPWIPSALLLGGPNPDFQAQLQLLGVDYLVADFPKVSNAIKFVKTQRVHTLYAFGKRRIPLMVAARFSGVCLLIAGERDAIPGFNDIWLRRFENRFVDGYIANSSYTARRLTTKCGISPEKVCVAYNGIPKKNQFSSSPSKSVVEIICVSNLLPNKGIEILLQAASRLREKYPQLKVKLVGRDYTNGEFAKRNMRFADIYSWVGYVPDVSSLLQRSTVFVLPSLSESISTAVLEAMAQGLPVIASNVGGTSELIQHGESGLLFESESINDLVRNLESVLGDTELQQKLATGALKASSHFTVRRMVAQHCDAMNQFTKKCQKRRSSPFSSSKQTAC